VLARQEMDMPQLDIQIAVAKIGKYATSESGDTLEMIERPQGGLSLVLADGQRSGRAAKLISNIVVRKAISLLADGVRDGAVARAAHDYLRAMRGGKVSATLNIVSIDLETETLVISRNSHCPSVVSSGGQIALLDEPSEAVGIRSWTKPVITELPLQPDTYILVYTDGLQHAGRRYGQSLDVTGLLRDLLSEVATQTAACAPAQILADGILGRAVDADQGRPGDDISVVVVSVLTAASESDDVRRMSVRFPIRVRQVV
jgi:serine phosphatase RsbU (regulator of sigma subunit)